VPIGFPLFHLWANLVQLPSRRSLILLLFGAAAIAGVLLSYGMARMRDLRGEGFNMGDDEEVWAIGVTLAALLLPLMPVDSSPIEPPLFGLVIGFWLFVLGARIIRLLVPD
jgi:hypothetical protein